MIKITEYKQMLADMLADINQDHPTEWQMNVVPVLSADETSFSKKLAETSGIVVGGQYPSVDVSGAEANAVNPTHPCLLFILEKKDLSTMTDADLDNDLLFIRDTIRSQFFVFFVHLVQQPDFQGVGLDFDVLQDRHVVAMRGLIADFLK